MTVSFGGGGPSFNTFNAMKVGRYVLQTPKVHAKHRSFVFGSAPAANASYGIDFGFKDQLLLIAVCYIAATEAECLAQFVADCDSAQGPVDVTISGVVYKRCYLNPEGSSNGDIRQQFGVSSDGTAGLVFVMEAVLSVSSKGAAE